MTNYEKIMNGMTPELLGKILDAVGAPCVMCAYQEELLREGYCPGSCREGIEKWLNQEEGNHE